MFNVDKIKKELESRGLDANSFDYLYNYLKSNDLLDKLSDYTNRLLKGEAELLVEKSVNYINNFFEDRVSILDIGTGSGCIAIALNKLVNSMVTAVDISNDALDVAKENNVINNTDVNFIVSDVFSNVNDKYDVIISNPPYICHDEEIMDIVYDNEPHLALYADMDGLYFYDKILSECKEYLNDKFFIAFEIGYLQADSIIGIVNKYLKDVNIIVDKDYSGKDRFIFITNCN